VEDGVEHAGEDYHVAGSSVVQKLYVFLYCGTQSDRQVAESMGYVYVGVDIEADIYLQSWAVG